MLTLNSLKDGLSILGKLLSAINFEKVPGTHTPNLANDFLGVE